MAVMGHHTAVSTRDYAKRTEKVSRPQNFNIDEESLQTSCPQIDSDFVFY